MPQWPSDWSGMLKPATDIEETDKQYKIATGSARCRGEGHPDHSRQRRADGAWREAPEQEKKEGGFHRVERSYGSFQRALNLPDDANQIRSKHRSRTGCSRSRSTSARSARRSRDARSRSTADVAGSFVTRKTRHETRSRGSRCLVASTLSTFSGASAWPENNAVCGQPATVRVEANLNGRHSTMLLCDDHYRQLVRQQSAPFRRWKPCSARAAPVRGLPRQ